MAVWVVCGQPVAYGWRSRAIESPPHAPAHPDQAVRLTLNGAAVDVDAHPMKRLLDVLREECSLTGTKEGCGEGECGACTVLVDGEPVCSCLIPWAHVEYKSVTTIEGLADEHPL